jgi:hypothetical protein
VAIRSRFWRLKILTSWQTPDYPIDTSWCEKEEIFVSKMSGGNTSLLHLSSERGDTSDTKRIKNLTARGIFREIVKIMESRVPHPFRVLCGKGGIPRYIS